MKPVYRTNAKALSRQIDAAIMEKEGRKVLRNSSRVALELVNEATADEALKANYKRTTKAWRRKIKQKGSYGYKYTGLQHNKGEQFSATTGVNYKKKGSGILKISHLIESGFRHVSGKVVRGNNFRTKAFTKAQLSTMTAFRNAFTKSIEFLNQTGKAPGLKMTRSFR